MNLTPLKYLLFIENITCIFRNYFCLKKYTRILVGCWAFIEVLTVTLNFVSYMQQDSEFKLNAQRIYFFSVTGFSIYIIVTPLYYAKRFYRLLSNFDAFHNIFADVVYARIMSKAQRRLTVRVVIFSCVQICVFTYMRIADDDIDIATTFVEYNTSVSDFRYIYQYFILNSILFVLSEQLNVITRSIDKDISAVRTAEGNIEYETEAISMTVNQNRLKKIDKLMNAYENVSDSSNLCNTMFSVQVFLI